MTKRHGHKQTKTREFIPVPCMTINTDASFCHNTKASGYAFYIKTSQFTLKHSGMFKKNSPTTPEEAEIMAIGNAIGTLLKHPDLPKIDWLIINSDCKNAMSKIDLGSTELGLRVYELREKLIELIGSKNNRLRHVKAHNGAPDARSWVNEWCDREAKKWMRKHRQILQEKLG